MWILEMNEMIKIKDELWLVSIDERRGMKWKWKRVIVKDTKFCVIGWFEEVTKQKNEKKSKLTTGTKKDRCADWSLTRLQFTPPGQPFLI